MSDANKQYWNERAQRRAGAATTDDVFLRDLEFKTLLAKALDVHGDGPGHALDLGCGDGLTTLRLAEALPALRFTGMDYAEQMVDLADRRLAVADADVRGRVEFCVGDVTALSEGVGTGRFDLALSNRCLINLGTPQRQYDALAQISDRLRKGGWYLGTENFVEGHDNLNQAREVMDLPPIPVRWHNLFFVESDFLEQATNIFESVDIVDFSSSYYFATRVVYSALCRMMGEEPDYHHEIHRRSPDLPPFGKFSPIRMIVAQVAKDA